MNCGFPLAVADQQRYFHQTSYIVSEPAVRAPLQNQYEIYLEVLCIMIQYNL